jgi:hypothetical protein
MTDKAVSALTSLTGANTATGDLLYIVDISEASAADRSKKITIQELFDSVPAGAEATPAIAAQGDQNTGIYFPAADTVAISTGGTRRAGVDASGNLLVGTTSAIQGGKYSSSFDGQTVNGIVLQTTYTTAGTTFIRFVNSSGTAQGEISANATNTVAYSTSSDYRLKDNITPMSGALAKVAALKPVTYKWKADGSDGEGFIAHELQAVVPQCVTGEKDAVDKEGKPVYQGIDTSFLVATLAAAIQELMQQVETLKAKVTALEAR